MAGQGTTPSSSSLKEYLKKYISNDEEDNKKKLKKKKKTKQAVSKVLLVDEDPVWQKPISINEEDDGDDSGEEKPQVDEDVEVRRMRRLEQLRSRRPYHALSEDGSGWVSISDTHVDSDAQNNLSPPRKGRARFDTPSPEPELASSINHRENRDLSPCRRHRLQDHNPLPGQDTEPSVAPILDQDISPPRRHRSQALADNKQKGLERTKKGDISPPRLGRQSSPVSDLSPPRKKRYFSPSPEPEAPTSDISPPRRSRTLVKEDTRWTSSQQHSPSKDLSPPRKNKKLFDRTVSHESSPRFSHQHSTKLGADTSPARNSQNDTLSLKERPKTGLVTGKDIKDEISKVKKNDWLR
uniref:BUD13 homolog n=1 Tax=Kalanchoe fedtschenkoi TaxID=63787 RepID=A0A7N0UKZ6_KALFE